MENKGGSRTEIKMTHHREFNMGSLGKTSLIDAVIGQGAGQREEQSELYFYNDKLVQGFTDRHMKAQVCSHTEMPQCTDKNIAEDAAL